MTLAISGHGSARARRTRGRPSSQTGLAVGRAPPPPGRPLFLLCCSIFACIPAGRPPQASAAWGEGGERGKREGGMAPAAHWRPRFRTRPAPVCPPTVPRCHHPWRPFLFWRLHLCFPCSRTDAHRRARRPGDGRARVARVRAPRHRAPGPLLTPPLPCPGCHPWAGRPHAPLGARAAAGADRRGRQARRSVRGGGEEGGRGGRRRGR